MAGVSVVIARGGRGGLGNAALASARRKAPGFALLGEPGEEVTVTLELKTVADIGLVGFPSAGKSSLIAAMSSARPKIADYPFTTLVPNLGVVTAGSTVFTVADVPGLIPGASQGKGLGLEFLRHVERCAALVHVLDCATLEPDRDPMSDLDMIEAELAEYGGLADRPRLVVLNKIDVPEGRELAEMVRADLEARGLPVFLVSAVSHEGLRELSFAMGRVVSEQRAATATPVAERIVIQPRAVDDSGYVVVREGEAFRVRGARPERWIRQTDFSNDEAVGYLADRLARLGVEEDLVRWVRSRATRSGSALRTMRWCSTGSRPSEGPGRAHVGRTSGSWPPRRASTAGPGRSWRRVRTPRPRGRRTPSTRARRPIAGAPPWRLAAPRTMHLHPPGTAALPPMRGRLVPDGCGAGSTLQSPGRDQRRTARGGQGRIVVVDAAPRRCRRDRGQRCRRPSWGARGSRRRPGTA